MDIEARQRIRYLRTRDGVQLAWAEAGEGTPLVKAANWLTHLQFEWQSPVWRHWVHFFASHFRFIRYDERGCGMSDWDSVALSPALSMDRWVDDLESVIDTAQPEDPFALLGISHGAATCIGYAARHPERVSRMILYGGYARGYSHRGDPGAEREYQAIIELFQRGWGRENPAFRQVFTSRFIPEATPEQLEWFNDLCEKTTSPEVAGELLHMRSRLNVVDLLEQIRVPTLVIHAREDGVVPLAEGRLLAARIPGAEFVELESKNHCAAGRRAGLDPVPGNSPRLSRRAPRAGGRGLGVRRALTAGAGSAGADHRGTGQRGDRRAALHQREDGPQSPLQRVRHARSVDARAGDGVRAGPRFPKMTELLSVAKDSDVNATWSLYTLKDSDIARNESSRQREDRGPHDDEG
jgi:pimeloyl-ACP methyl ester carboxylesterase